MCNADITLGVTDDYEDYGILETHTCRDYDAIVRWVESNRWSGFLEWTFENQQRLSKLHSADMKTVEDHL